MLVERKLLNRSITANQVMLIDETGSNIGTLTLQQALQMAEDRGFDLVQMNQQPVPVCKLMDFKKSEYEKKKKEKEHRVKAVKVKEVYVNLNTGAHDMEIKADHISKFIADKMKVKVSVRLKGRRGDSNTTAEIAKEMLNTLLKMVEGSYKQDGTANKSNYEYSVMIMPS